MTRSKAREIAVHLLFEQNFNQQDPASAISTLTDSEYYSGLVEENDAYSEVPDEKQLTYIMQVLCGVMEHQEELDAYIEKYAVGWGLSRIPKLSLAIMRTAIYEILYVEDVPAGVAVNEAVELSKKYEEAEMAAFINGILGSVVRAL